jgi:hypothetical protein
MEANESIEIIYDMLEEITEHGDIPHMLIVPRSVIDEVGDEFPNIPVFTGTQHHTIHCVIANPCCYRDGQVVLH